MRNRMGLVREQAAEALALWAVPGTAVGATPRPLPAADAAAAAAVADAPAGWRLVASDDFTGSQPGSVWGEYGGTYGIGANAWSADEVSTSDGTLRVKMERKASQGKAYTSGGVGMWGLAQTYGRYEFQAMAPTIGGIDSYAVLWPPDGDDGDATLVELLAKPATAPGQQAAYVTINYGGDKSEARVPGSYCGAFHDYVIEWTPTYESVSVDGKVLLKSPKSTSMKRWIGFVTSNGDTLTGTPSASAALPAEFDIRHLRVYAYSPGAPGTTPTTPSSAGGHPTTSSSASKTPSSAPKSSTPSASATPAKSANAAAAPSSLSPAASSSGAPTSTAQSSAASATSPGVALSAEGTASTSHGAQATPILLAIGVGGVATAAVVYLMKKPQGSRRLK
ncbi:glycoside hydrolase family 16 protein [Catenulispora yoronensis]